MSEDEKMLERLLNRVEEMLVNEIITLNKEEYDWLVRKIKLHLNNK